ncbi:MAG: murein biosynthesis integral membrane protein MurJ [Gammaproteobacteria bacterium]|jgi:putative peptidoglycan lipid II flippase|nr:murein biosynthesis integral membrane protein MurJ [Gammaproteobacteria bacterium]
MSRRILQSTVVTGAMTLLSRITGLVRDVLFASLLGAGAGIAADAFYVALRVPNFLRRIFGEGAFAQAFVPVLVEYREGHEEETRNFVAAMGGSLGVVLAGVSLVGVLAAPLLIYALAPGFATDADKFDLTVRMLRITFPYLFFISLVAMASGILNSFHRFGVPAFTPVLLNISLILAAVVFAPHTGEPVIALAWGVFAAGVAQLLFQFPFLARLHLLRWPRPAFRDPGVKRVFRLMVPAIFGSSVAQVNLLVNTLLASFLVTGSVSWLYYSDRLMEFPLGVFGIALATVMLPSLSRAHARGGADEFSRLLDFSLRWCVLIALPATVGLVLLAPSLVTTLFQYGAFGVHDVEMSARALVAFALGLPAFILVKLLAPGFFARQDTRTPARFAVYTVLVNIGLSLLLVGPLGHVGLALAISVAAVVNCALLYRRLRRDGTYQPQPGWTIFIARVALGCVLMGLTLWWFAGVASDWLLLDVWGRVTRLALLVAGGGVVYAVSLLVAGIHPRQLVLSGVELGED